MSDDHFNYDQLMLDAHRELIRQVLLNVAKSGLPGEHHFFIIFSTTHKETRISDRLRAQYPSEMTIVLQHQYSNLKIHKDRFEIQLSFNRIPELLVIPFAAITGFVDPSVPFGLQLAGDAAAGLENSIGMLVPGLPQGGRSEGSRDEAAPEAEATPKAVPPYDIHAADEIEQELETVVDLWESEDTSVPSIVPSKKSTHEADDHEPVLVVDEEDSDETSEDDEAPAANIVQLDAFRKKSK